MGRVMNTAEINDAALMRSVAVGDYEVFHNILETYLDLVVRTSFRILCDSDDSKAVAVEVFGRIWMKAGQYDSSRPLSEWLLVMTCRLCRRRYFIRRLPGMLTDRPEVYVMSHPSLPWDDDYITKQAWEFYCRASAKLSLRERVIYTLCELEGLTISQVHYITGLRPSAIIDALMHARNQVRNHISYRAYVNFLRRMTVSLADTSELEREIRARINFNMENSMGRL